MKLPNRLLPFSLVLLALTASPLAFSGEPSHERPFDCADSLLPASLVDRRDTLTREIRENIAQQNSLVHAESLVRLSITEAMKMLVPADQIEKVSKGLSILVNNPIFSEALSRALYLSDVRSIEGVEAFKEKLGKATEPQQIAFANVVIRQYDSLLDKAFAMSDEDRLKDLNKRWKLTADDAFDILKHWNTMGESRKAEIALGTLAWAKVIDAEFITAQIQKLRKVRDLPLRDSEKTLAVQILQPHTDIDLAMNRGPITEDEFDRRLRMWTALGVTKYITNRILYSKASFAVLASFAPVGIVHGIMADWNITNTLATVVGGVATCAPIVDSFAMKEIAQQHDAVWLDILSLRQLSEFKRWVAEHSKSAKELGFYGLEASVDARIKQLRNLRYAD